MHYAHEVHDIEARAPAVRSEVTTIPDGVNHPHLNSSKARIPVSVAEKRWLFGYFDSIGDEIKQGNYYRYSIRLLHIYAIVCNNKLLMLIYMLLVNAGRLF